VDQNELFIKAPMRERDDEITLSETEVKIMSYSDN
jgi:hypothetical protein